MIKVDDWPGDAPSVIHLRGGLARGGGGVQLRVLKLAEFQGALTEVRGRFQFFFFNLSSLPFSTLQAISWWTFRIFYSFVSARGGVGGVRGARRGGGSVFIENPTGYRGGGGAGRVSAANW